MAYETKVQPNGDLPEVSAFLAVTARLDRQLASLESITRTLEILLARVSALERAHPSPFIPPPGYPPVYFPPRWYPEPGWPLPQGPMCQTTVTGISTPQTPGVMS